MKYAVVFVEGGCVQDIAGVDNYSIVDYDCLEGGECPICREFTTTKFKNTRAYIRSWLVKFLNKHLTKQRYAYKDTFTWCSECEVNWDQPPEQDVQIELARKSYDKCQL